MALNNGEPSLGTKWRPVSHLVYQDFLRSMRVTLRGAETREARWSVWLSPHGPSVICKHTASETRWFINTKDEYVIRYLLATADQYTARNHDYRRK